ncbi:MAG: hypothetical protein OXE52_20985 [Chloroflexi bacterium]|nr:hypothetical protein [Chloroflexota bacterium]
MRYKRILITALPFLLVTLIAFGYRLIIMEERASAPNQISAWDPLPIGTDQNTYIAQMHELFRGEFPPKAFFYQPGIVYFLAAVAKVIQSTELYSLRLALVALASLNCGLMAMIAAWATGRRRAGLLAGLLLAFYPVSAYYDTDFIITSQAVILATLMLGFAWWAIRRPRNLLASFALGILLGAGIVTRFQLIAPGFICVIWAVASRGWVRAATKVSLALIGLLLLTLPVILHNRAGGANHLIVPIGPRVFYYGNARDAEGIASRSNAERSTKLDYFHYFLQDVALEPRRFIELSLHKVGVFLSSFVTGQNLDYQEFRDDSSGALALNPLNFTLLFALSLVGWRMLWQQRETRSLSLLLVTGFCAYLLAVMGVYVETRFRTPVVAWMLPAAGLALDRLFQALRSERLTALIRRYYKQGLAISGLLLAVQFALDSLPQDVIVPELPSSATATGLRYDDTLELLGWQVRPQYSARHTIKPFHPWVVSLYWRLLQPTEQNYAFSLKYFIGDKAIIEYDRPIGYTVFPRDRTSEWHVGKIYVEHIGITWRSYDGPFEKTGNVTVFVLPEGSTKIYSPQTASGEVAAHPTLAKPAILHPPGRNRLSTSLEVSFDDQLILLGYEMPPAGDAGGTLPLRSAWRTGQRQIEQDLSIGIYFFLDADFIANDDRPPKNGELRSFSLLPNYHFDDERLLDLPPQSGVYEVYVGVYDARTMIRLPLAGSANELYRLGTVELG